MRSSNKLYNADRVTDTRRVHLYQKLEAEGVCQFCPRGVELGYVKKARQGKHWYIVENTNPYPGTRAHWMAISTSHDLDIGQLRDGEGEELFALFAEFMSVCGVPGASMVMRFGDMSHTCSSIAHPHVHFVAAHAGTLGDKTFQMDLGYWPRK